MTMYEDLAAGQVRGLEGDALIEFVAKRAYDAGSIGAVTALISSFLEMDPEAVGTVADFTSFVQVYLLGIRAGMEDPS